MDSRGKVSSVLALVLVLAAGWLLSRRAIERGRAQQIPEGLALARRSAIGVDILGWEGGAWSSLLAEGVLGPIEQDGQRYNPEISLVLPSPSGARLALALSYCRAEDAEDDAPSHPCLMGGRAFLYEVGSGQLSPLQKGAAQPLIPFRWQDEGSLLVTETGEDLAAYRLADGSLSPLAIPDGDITLSGGPDGMSADGALLAYSAEDHERVWRLTESASELLPGGPSDYNSSWLSFSRHLPAGEARVAVVAPTLATMLGAGALRVVHLATGSVTQVAAASSLAFDYNPAWAGTEQLAFLRGDGDSWQPGRFGEESERMPAAVMVVDLASGSQTELLPPDAVRRKLAAPHQAGNLVFLRSDEAGRPQAFGARLAGGGEFPLHSDDLHHTAIGWAE